MRSLQAASDNWQEFKKYPSLRELKEAVRLDGHHTSAASSGLRSLCWKAVLLFDSVDTEEWMRVTSSSRSAYNSLRMHFLRHFENPDEVAETTDPLSDQHESSIWTELRKDEELRAEIMQDVDRCMPESTYFRQPETQRVLLDVLFIFCKLNQDVGYRQGMHELLAPILWVVERDAIDLGQSSKTMGEDAMVRAIFDAEHIEHDAFALFSQVMHSAKTFYEQTTHSASDNPIVIRSQRIFNELLPQVDRDLAKHLEDIDIVPQVFLMRWIRLLFGREFSFDEMLTMWDVIFMEDPSLQLVEYICVAMLLRIRWELLDADYNAVLTLLLRYPAPEKDFPPQTFVTDAIYLQTRLTAAGGNYLVSKYTGRPLRQQTRSATPPAIQRNTTAFSGLNAAQAAPSVSLRLGRSQNNIETLFQSTAKNIYARGEKLGIGKAVRSAVDEVHKKALEIRDSQAPSPSANWRVNSPRSGPGALYHRITKLEARNKQLSELLQGAVGELWYYQKLATDTKEDGRTNPEDVDKLSAAIAKVQFVQVYLSDPSLPLPDDSEVLPTNPLNVNDTENDASSQQRPETLPKRPCPTTGPSTEHIKSETLWEQPDDTTKIPEALDDPSKFETDSPPPSPTPKAAAAEQESVSPTRINDDIAPSPSPRPPLDQTSLSWMLGESASTAPSSFHQASAFSSHRGEAPARGLLFGGQSERNDATIVEAAPAKRRAAKTRAQRSNAAPTATVLSTDENVFDMGSLRRAKKS